MDEKEKNLYDDVPADDVNQQEDNTLEEKDGVMYETNDNWQFEAEAPTLSDELFDNTDVEEDSTQDNEEDGNGDSQEDDKEEKPETEGETPMAFNYGFQDDNVVPKKKPIKFILIAIVILAVIAVVAVFTVRYFTVPNGKEGKMANPASVALTVDDNKVSVGMYNLYYSSVVSQYEQYAYYGYYNLDTTSDYSNQYTTDEDGNEIKWSDYFEQEALTQIKYYTTYYNVAKKEGLTLTQAQQDIIDERIEGLKTSASESGQSLNDYIASVFGEYCTEDTVRLYMEQYYLTANYIGKYAIDNRTTDEEATKYFEEHKTDYYQINISYLATSYDLTSDETKAESEKKIKDYMSKITDRQSIIDLVPTVYKDYINTDVQTAMANDDTLSEKDAIKQVTKKYQDSDSIDASISANQSPFDDEITDWLFDENQPTGTVKYYVNDETGYAYIILKTEQATRMEDETYAVRHILIQPEADEDTPTDETTGKPIYTDEQWAAAEEQANKILDEYNNGDKTEYSFALLAEQYSSDPGSITTGSGQAFGGLYENVNLGDMVPEFENWATDKSREYGDTGIVKSDYGYHIMFFIYDKPSYEGQVITDARNAKLDSIVENAECDLHDSVINKANEKFLASKRAANEAQAETAE